MMEQCNVGIIWAPDDTLEMILLIDLNMFEIVKRNIQPPNHILLKSPFISRDLTLSLKTYPVISVL